MSINESIATVGSAALACSQLTRMSGPNCEATRIAFHLRISLPAHHTWVVRSRCSGWMGFSVAQSALNNVVTTAKCIGLIRDVHSLEYCRFYRGKGTIV